MDNSFVRTLVRMKAAVHMRWRALCFARRFYRSARETEPQVLESAAPAPAQDFTESLFRRSVPANMHALVQLRVASQLASIEATRLRSRMCREAGWSSEQIGGALIGNLNGSFSEPEKLVLRYADDMTRTPIDVDPQLVVQLRSYFSRSDLVELTACIAHENFRIRFGEASQKLS